MNLKLRIRVKGKNLKRGNVKGKEIIKRGGQKSETRGEM